MKFSSVHAMVALSAITATAKPLANNRRATPTIYTIGDSTMAEGGAGNGETDGWGQYLGNYTTATVVNKAIAGRSARSYWEEGRFQDVADLVADGDVVVIEFGHVCAARLSQPPTPKPVYHGNDETLQTHSALRFGVWRVFPKERHANLADCRTMEDLLRVTTTAGLIAPVTTRKLARLMRMARLCIPSCTTLYRPPS